MTCGRGQRQRRRAARAGGRGNAVGLTSIFDRGMFLHREAEKKDQVSFVCIFFNTLQKLVTYIK